MTSIQWLIEQFNLQAYSPHIEQAKEMHKKEIIDAWKMGRYDSDEIVMTETFYAEKYYNKTFKSCQ
jgi:hypothetical protein